MYDLWSYALLFLFIYHTVADRVGLRADGTEEYADTSVPGYKSHTDIRTKWKILDRTAYPIENAPYAKARYSPTTQFYKLPLAEPTSILFTLRNLGEFTFNITSITGFLHAAHRFSFYVQNSTRREINSELRAHSEMTLEYQFMAWPGLPAVDYVLSGDVEYQLVTSSDRDSRESIRKYSNQFVNVTVSMESSDLFWVLDYQLLLMLLIIILFWALMALLFYEFWWIPNQLAQGKQPLKTQDFVMRYYQKYLHGHVEEIKGKMISEPPKSESSSASNERKNNNSWLAGTGAKMGPRGGGGSGRNRFQSKKKKKNK